MLAQLQIQAKPTPELWETVSADALVLTDEADNPLVDEAGNPLTG